MFKSRDTNCLPDGEAPAELGPAPPKAFRGALAPTAVTYKHLYLQGLQFTQIIQARLAQFVSTKFASRGCQFNICVNDLSHFFFQ